MTFPQGTVLTSLQRREAIYETVLRAVTGISPDVRALMEAAYRSETNPSARSMLRAMLDNLDIAGAKRKAVCQSPGYPTVWLRFGDGGPREDVGEIVARAVGDATGQGYLRPSIVDPLTRQNSGNNSGTGVPNLELTHVPGLRYTDFIISFKGCGAELGNALKIMTPAGLGPDLRGLKRFVLETVIEAGGKPCPPCGIGIGIGGQMDVAAKLSRKAISTRMWNDCNPDPELAALEEELLHAINRLQLGPAGIGGDTTVLAVKLERAHTHTAIAPVAVNYHCWVARRAGIRIHDNGDAEIIL